MLEVKGARVVITGASSGIGAAAADAFAAAGAHVHLLARRVERLEDIAARCRTHGVEAHAHRVDVTDRAALFELAAFIEQDHGAVDVAIANAGVMQLGPLMDMAWSDLERQLAVNVAGVMHTLQAFGRAMLERDRGILMPVSSILAVQALPRYAGYCASKYAVQALADSLRMELVHRRVEVVHVLPGATATELHAHMDEADMPKATRQTKRVPPEQVARRMVAAVRRPRANVLCDARGRLLWWGKRAAPWLVDAVVRAVTRGEQR